MRTRRYHFGDRPSRTLLPFLRISPERRMVEREIFPSRMSLSLSFFAPNEGSSARQEHRRRRSLSTLSHAFVSIADKRQRGVCLSSKFSARVSSNSSRPMGKFNPQKLCALSLSCASLETERRTKNVAHGYSRSLDGLAMPACLSRSRIRECKEREKRSKICPESASFFPSFLYSPIKCSQFSQRAGESETTTGCEILLFEPNTHREKTTTKKTKKEENFMSAYYFRSV